MSQIFAWAMRNGAEVLFGASLILFAVSMVSALAGLGGSASQMFIGSQPLSREIHFFIISLSGVASGLSTAALPFAGALAIHRWDRLTKKRSLHPAESD